VHAHELEREQDVERLRRIALAQHAQIEQLIAALARKCKELETFKGSKDELQQTLALIDSLTKQQKAIEKQGAKPKEPKPRAKTGQTDQKRLPIVEKVCTLDEGERICDACGGDLHAMVGQFEESELIDVIEVEYRVLAVKRPEVHVPMRRLHQDRARARARSRWTSKARSTSLPDRPKSLGQGDARAQHRARQFSR
jgi:hypothetical protein